jgi:hypothetical protein
MVALDDHATGDVEPYWRRRVTGDRRWDLWIVVKWRA